MWQCFLVPHTDKIQKPTKSPDCSWRSFAAEQETMGFHKSTLVARGTNTQLDPSCVSAPLATNVDLFACFAERLFKN